MRFIRTPTARPLATLAGLAALLLAGCAGGSKADQIIPNTIRVTGKVEFERYVGTIQKGINYENLIVDPVRGAKIETRTVHPDPDLDNLLIDSGTIDDIGRFDLQAPGGETFKIVVYSEIPDPNSTIEVRDNTHPQLAVYSAESEIRPQIEDAEVEFTIESGWDGNDYSEPRASAPFNVLDIAYKARRMIRDARGESFAFKTLDIYWSVNNRPSNVINYSTGFIGGAHFTTQGQRGGDNFGDSVYLSGLEDVDTDEFDQGLVGHEWFHYWEENHSRSDSLGGAHFVNYDPADRSKLTYNDILDDTIAFGEGFATAMGGLINDNEIYVDSQGEDQGEVGVYLNLEKDQMADALTWKSLSSDDEDPFRRYDGYWSEISIAQVIWDIYDNRAGEVDDKVNLGTDEIVDVMVDSQAFTPYFTSIYTFLYHLKRHPDVTDITKANIDDLAIDENILPGTVEYDVTGYTPYPDPEPSAPAGYARYIEVPVLPDDTTPAVDTDRDDYTLTTRTLYGDSRNKLWNRHFFRTPITTAGTYTVKIWPVQTDRSIRIDIPGTLGVSGSTTYTTTVAAGQDLVYAVFFFQGNRAVATEFAIGVYPDGVTPPDDPPEKAQFINN